MRHLKKFNESKQLDKERLRDFCEESLAYLMDDGLHILIEWQAAVLNSNSTSSYMRLIISFSPPFTSSRKSWSELKDQIIPFLIRLNRKYDLHVIDQNKDDKDCNIGLRIYNDNCTNIYVWYTCSSVFCYTTIDFLISDCMEQESKIASMVIEIKGEKL